MTCLNLILVFAVFFMPETLNFVTYSGVEDFFLNFCFLTVYAYISNVNYKNILILKKIEFGHFRVQNPLNKLQLNKTDIYKDKLNIIIIFAE